MLELSRERKADRLASAAEVAAVADPVVPGAGVSLPALVEVIVKSDPSSAERFREAIERGLVSHAEARPGIDRAWAPGERQRVEEKPREPPEAPPEKDAPGWDQDATRRAKQASETERAALDLAQLRRLNRQS